MESPYEPMDQVPQPPARQPWSPRRKLAVAILLLLVFVMGILWVFNRSGSIRRPTEVDAVRAAGRPVTIEELQAQRAKIPDAENSALRIVPLFDDLEKRVAQVPLPRSGDFGDDWAELGERLSPAMMDVIGSYLRDRQDLLAKLHEAAKFPRGAYPIQWTPDGVSTLLPHLSKVRAATRLLCLEAEYRANRGDADGAADSCLAALRVAASVGDEPLIISMLVRIACEATAIDALQRTLALGTPGEAGLDRFRAELLPLADDKQPLVRAFDGERVLMLACLSALKQGKVSAAALGTGAPAPTVTLETIVVRFAPGYVDMNEAQYLRKTRPWWAAADLPLKDYLREIQGVDQAIPSISRFYVFVRMMMPSLGRASQLFALSRMRIRATIAALDAERFYRREGRWPAKLDDLVADPQQRASLLADVFDDDKPMRYRIDDAGCVIYSVADDGADDGGKLARSKKDENQDAGFRLLLPSRRGVRTTTQPIDEEDLKKIQQLRSATRPAATQPGESPR